MVESKGEGPMEEAKKKPAKRGARTVSRRNGFEVRVVETRYGLRVLIRQGDNRVWLGERHLAMLFNAILARVFQAGGED